MKEMAEEESQVNEDKPSTDDCVTNVSALMEVKEEINKESSDQQECNDEDHSSSEPTPVKTLPKKKITWDNKFPFSKAKDHPTNFFMDSGANFSVLG